MHFFHEVAIRSDADLRTICTYGPVGPVIP